MSHRALGLLSLAVAVSLAGRARADEDRGYLGALLGPVPDVLEHHLGTKGGAIVEDVTAGSPAEKAGLRRHDVITGAGGESVKGPEDMKKMVRAMKPGDKLKLSLRRGGETLDIEASLGSLAAAAEDAKRAAEVEGAVKAPQGEAERPAEKPSDDTGVKRGFFGVGFGDVPAVLSEHLGLADGVGVIVEDVWAGSPAQKAGIEKSDLLIAFDGYEVKGAADFARLVGEKKVGDKVKVDLLHKGAKSSVEVTLVERPAELARVPEDPFQLIPGAPNGPGRLFQQPFHRKGRIIIEGPEGRSWKYELPDGVWKVEDLSRDLGEKMKGFEKDLEKEFGKIQHLINPEELSRRLKKLTEELDDLKQDGPGISSSRVESHSSVVRLIDGDYDIAIQDQNGARTFTVKKGDKALAEDLPWDKLSTLPDDVRARVEKVAENIKTVPVPRLPRATKDTKVKA